MDETPSRRTSKSIDTEMPSPVTEPSTPVSSAVKPPRSEMHPSRYHSSTDAPSSALRLGFSDIPKHEGTTRVLDGTPTRANRLPTSSFTFRIARDAADAELSGDAQRMLDEIRDQAAKIKAELISQREAEGEANIRDRAFAKPKGKAGRYSAAHMAEFKKMDSIEGHASAWRAQEGRFTPIKSLKRSPSKANLDTTPATQKCDPSRSPTKVRPNETLGTRPKASLKRSSLAANLDGERLVTSKRNNGTATSGKTTNSNMEPPQPSAKRFKKREQDDAATSRPKSVDFSSSKPNSVFSRLASPTKSSMNHSVSVMKPTINLVNASSKPMADKLLQSSSCSSLSSVAELKRRIISPKSFSKVKSILRGGKTSAEENKSAIPHPSSQGSLTPAPPRVNKELPPIPLTTPRRKLTKRVTFTPEVASFAVGQNSPSPQRKGVFKLRSALKPIETHYPALDEVLTESKPGHSLYPDLSPLKHLIQPQDRRVGSASPSVPGKFTFRSDHTIKFGESASAGFGASLGQSSVRHVRMSTASGPMPGTFPTPPSPSSHPNKENKAPSPVKLLPGTAHGMQNKKRHRASSDDGDFDSIPPAKKRKNESVPEGDALVAPRLVNPTMASALTASRVNRTPSKTPTRRSPVRTPGRTPVSPSPIKRSGGGLSLSRLNMLARPKNRN